MLTVVVNKVSATIGAARHAQHRRLRRDAHAPPAELREAAALLLRRDHSAAAGRSPLGFELEVLNQMNFLHDQVVVNRNFTIFMCSASHPLMAASCM